MDNLIRTIPDFIFAIYAASCLFLVSGYRFKLKTSIIVSVISVLGIIGVNILFVIFLDNFVIDDWFLLTIFLPEAIVAWVLGKRRSISLVAAILNGFLIAYSIILVQNIILTTNERPELEYVVYFFAFPIMIFFLLKFYIPLHNELEKFSSDKIGILILYAAFLILEFYSYGALIRETTIHVLRLEIFGIAIFSVYALSIITLSFFVKSNNRSIYHEASTKILKKEINYIKEQAKANEYKNEKLRILRHDMRHILYNVSSLIKDNKNEDALKLISNYINEIETTKEAIFTKDSFINATLDYFYNLCDKENIKLNIDINNVEDALNIPSAEVAVVISNALENAVKSTKELVDNKVIDFKFINNNGRLILSIENYYDNEVLLNKDGTPISNEEGHGIGSQSIKAFAKKYNLVLNYDITSTKFRLTILFN